AGSARLRQVHRSAEGPRRPGRRHHLDVPGSADGPPGEQQEGGRGSPRLRLGSGRAMSRIGKAPITVPSGVDVKVDGQTITVRGPEGELTEDLPAPVTASVEGNASTVNRPDDHRDHRSLHGLSRSLVNNMVVGVTEGY